jgi:hypothetical protein
MTSITLNGNDYSDDGSETRDMTEGGHRDWLLPMLSDAVTDLATKQSAAASSATGAASSASTAATSAATALAAPGTNATSSTSVAIGTGSKTFTIETGKSIVVGMFVVVAYTTTPTNWMFGNVTAYNSGTGSLTVEVNAVNGSGTYAAWTVSISGASTGVGKQTIWIPATAMKARLTNGAALGTVETTTNKIMIQTLDFDASTIEYAQFGIRMPKGWNEGTVTAYFLWSNASGTGNVVWAIQAVAISDDDALDAAFGTAQSVTDGVTAAGDLMQSAETSAITIAGSPAAGDLVVFQAYRDASNGSDTFASDARLHGVVVIYTTDTANDA